MLTTVILPNTTGQAWRDAIRAQANATLAALDAIEALPTSQRWVSTQRGPNAESEPSAAALAQQLALSRAMERLIVLEKQGP